jgi:eukaryotic-like serine/threonine-protein kinase
VKRLGAYEVIAQIGAGGMATVYLGRVRDDAGEERVAAIKVVKQELAGQDEFVQMFLDEAHILSLLHHPNLSAALEYGTSGDRHFIAMEFLMGRTVKEVWDAAVAQGSSLGFDLPAWICARVADGLFYAHGLCDGGGNPLHLIHRDVNPGNIFLTYGNEVKLFDFGLAKAKGKRHTTRAGVIKGKVSYLSPEQIEMLPLDGRSDIYALGVALWELTTMRRLFQASTDLEVVAAIRAGRVPDARELAPNYPDRLWSIVSKALQRDRADRYATAKELADDLDRFVLERRPGAGWMQGRLAALLDDLFLGERKRQDGWLPRTTSHPAAGGLPMVQPPAPMMPLHPSALDGSPRPPRPPKVPTRR